LPNAGLNVAEAPKASWRMNREVHYDDGSGDRNTRCLVERTH
jgi:hypothetical protein